LNSRIVSVVKYLLFLSLAIFLLYWTFQGQDIGSLFNNIKNANYLWVLASVLACLVAHVLRAIRWTLLIEPLGYNISTKNSFYAVMIGYLANLAFPRLGEVSRCGVLNKTDKVPMNQLLGTVITERLFDLLLLLSTTFLAILLEFKRISGFIYQHVWLKLEAVFANGLALWLSLIGMVLILFFYLIRSRIRILINPFSNTLKGFKSGLLSFWEMKNKGPFMLLSVLIWFCYFLSTYLCFFALLGTAQLSPLAALSALVLGSLGMIVPVQGGIGAFHWMVAEGLGLYGIDKLHGLAFATLIHSSQLLVILIIGGISLILTLLYRNKN
jgi:uncharacterized protein (TIRG00374 family)